MGKKWYYKRCPQYTYCYHRDKPLKNCSSQLPGSPTPRPGWSPAAAGSTTSCFSFTGGTWAPSHHLVQQRCLPGCPWITRYSWQVTCDRRHTARHMSRVRRVRGGLRGPARLERVEVGEMVGARTKHGASIFSLEDIIDYCVWIWYLVKNDLFSLFAIHIVTGALGVG